MRPEEIARAVNDQTAAIADQAGSIAAVEIAFLALASALAKTGRVDVEGMSLEMTRLSDGVDFRQRTRGFDKALGEIRRGLDNIRDGRNPSAARRAR